jgi:hypothetical protein
MLTEFLCALFKSRRVKRRATDGPSQAEKVSSLKARVCPDCGCPDVEVVATAFSSWESTTTETREATIRNKDGDETGSIEWEVETPVTRTNTVEQLRCWFCDANYELDRTR